MRLLGTVAAIAIACLFATPATARTPTPSITQTPTITLTYTFGPSPTPTETATEMPTQTATPTGTQPGPYANARIEPPIARSGQRVILDGTASFRPTFYHWTQTAGDVAIQIDDADQPIASFIVPPLANPTVVNVELAIADGDFWPAYGIELLPERTIQVLLTHDIGAPGGTARMNLVLRPWGLGVTSLTHMVAFDAFTEPVRRADGSPDCDAGPSVDLDHAVFAFTPPGCTPGVSCTGLRAEVVARRAMEPEAAVYTCRIGISSAPRESCHHVLQCDGGSAATAEGLPLTLDCSDGSISANYAYESLNFTFRAEPPEPQVGDTVELIFTVSGNGGLPGYTLSGAEPLLHITGPTPTPGGGLLGGEVRFTTVADCPGSAPIQLSVYYEGRGGCPGGAEYFNFRTAVSPVFRLAVREPGTSVLRGRVASDAGTCANNRPGVIVVLEPLGWRVTSDAADGEFSFGGVPSGEYSIRLAEPCDAAGCYAAQPVTIADGADAAVVLCPGAVDVCPGDCDRNRRVEVAELVRGVQITLGTDDLTTCPVADSNGDDSVAVDDLVRAINAALGGCGS